VVGVAATGLDLHSSKLTPVHSNLDTLIVAFTINESPLN
jgi:hypothetical protein